MPILTIFSAVTGGIFGLLDGYKRKPPMEPKPYREVLPPGSYASEERHRTNVKKQMYEWFSRLRSNSPEEHLTTRWIRHEWASGRIVPETALACPVLFSSYLTEHPDGTISVQPPWGQFDSNAKSIA